MWDFSKNTMLKKAVFLIAFPFNSRNMFGRRTGYYTLCSKGSLLCLNFSSNACSSLVFSHENKFSGHGKTCYDTDRARPNRQNLPARTVCTVPSSDGAQISRNQASPSFSHHYSDIMPNLFPHYYAQINAGTMCY